MTNEKKQSRFYLSRLSLYQRFVLIFGLIAVSTLILLFFYANYAKNVTRKEFEKRGELLSYTIGTESIFGLIMQDEEGLYESLNNTITSGSALAGAFFDERGNLFVENNFLDTIREKDRSVTSGDMLTWTETAGGDPTLISVTEIINENSKDKLGYVAMALPANAITAQARTSTIITLIISFIFLAFASIFLVYVRKTIFRPVNELRTAARTIQSGDLSIRVSIATRDEIGELASSFNAMVDASERNTNALREQSQQAEATGQKAEQLQFEADAKRLHLQQQFEEISRVIAAVTHGDLTQRLDAVGDDEVGALMNQINQMIHDLSILISEVHGASDHLSEAAERVASSAEEMSAGASGQAHQTAEVAAAIEEMSATIAESSKNAFDANEMARQASDLASSGEEIFRATTEGMQRIAGLVQDSAEKVTALGESSAQIGNIIQVIGDIADQTNLLALNAAIEAARAGDQGRGFAVVADEVRKLAERTTAATKEIAQMIKRIQRNTDDVVASMTRGNQEAETGLQLSSEAKRSLNEIVAAINDMVGMIDQIAASSEQQSVTSSEISQNVEAISSVSEEVSRSTSDLSTTAETLTQQNLSLRQIIKRFRLGDTGRVNDMVIVGGDGAPRPTV